MGPWLKLAGHLGSFIGQMTDEPVKAINILYDGSVSSMNLEALNCSVIAGIMKKANPDVNLVSAPFIAKERGIQISTTNQDKSGAFDGYIKVTVVTAERERSIAGTVFSDGKPRFIQIKGINIDAEIGEHMLYTTNKDVPGVIGTLGQIMGRNGVNIANFTLGRAAEGGEAIALLYVDHTLPKGVLSELSATGVFDQIKPLAFEVRIEHITFKVEGSSIIKMIAKVSSPAVPPARACLPDWRARYLAQLIEPHLRIRLGYRIGCKRYSTIPCARRGASAHMLKCFAFQRYEKVSVAVFYISRFEDLISIIPAYMGLAPFSGKSNLLLSLTKPGLCLPLRYPRDIYDRRRHVHTSRVRGPLAG